MMLKNKVAAIYRAGGATGGAVARAFASEGARVLLTGRKRAPVC
jgi:NAD(P)-dependent dehydrogenase (short-subunit alcohol dehydrogenase family)